MLMRRLALAFVFAWFFLGGIGHFVLTDLFTSIVPPYVPFPREVVLATGVCEIAGALALLSQRLRPIAGGALMILIVCVTPANIEMLIHSERYGVSVPALWLRLLFQPVLVWIVWRATRETPALTPPRRRSSWDG